MKEKKNRNQYYLKFYVSGSRVVPKDPSMFHLEKNSLEKHNYCYTLKTEQIGTRLDNIDRLTNSFYCDKELIQSYFEDYNPESNNVIVSVELIKNKEHSIIPIDPIYRATRLREILHYLQNTNGHLYTDSIPYQNYINQYHKWLTDDKFKEYLLNSTKIGKKMKENLVKYQGYTDSKSCYMMDELMRNSYPILRGTYIAASEYFPEFIEEKETNKETYNMLYEEQQQKEIEIARAESPEFNYLMRLHSGEKLAEFNQKYEEGTLSLEDSPLSEEAKERYRRLFDKLYQIERSPEEMIEMQKILYFGIECEIEEEELEKQRKR